jgi:hypothetical protein
MEASQHSLLAACFTLHSINATLAIVPQRGAGLWIAEGVYLLLAFKTSSMRFDAHLGTSQQGPPYAFKDAWVVVDSLTGIHNGRVKCLFVANRSCIHKGFRCPHR